MGREIRKVPPNWDHPKTPEGHYQPMFNETFKGEGNPLFYRTWKDEKATWYQLWETVSEGTPVSPPFATREELIEYLVTNGDFWDQQRRREGCTVMNCAPWSRKQAEKFVNSIGWAPSFIMDSIGLQSGKDAL